MLLEHIIGFFLHPSEEWESVRARNIPLERVIFHILLLGAIPVISGFIGTTQFGWQIGTAETIKITTGSAAVIAVIYYIVIIAAVFSVAWMIHWMGQTYGARQPLTRCLVLAAYIPIPLFLVGIAQIYPVLWFNLIIGIPAATYTVFLLYLGIPVMMEIPPERGFLFSSAVLAFGLVGLVGMLAATVILWGFGLGPVFTS
jgi:hypothetical protein